MMINQPGWEMYKVFSIFGALAVLALILAGCGSATTETVTVTQTVASSPDSSDSQATSTPLSQGGAAGGNFSGTANMTTQKFSLKAGAVRFAYKYGGTHNFVVVLMDSSGKSAGLIANVIGAADSTKVINIREDGEFTLDIEADNVWTVTVRPE